VLVISKRKWRSDGLNNLTYDLISITRKQLFVKVNVYIDMNRVRRYYIYFFKVLAKLVNIIGLSYFQNNQFNTVFQEICRFYQIIGTHYNKVPVDDHS
jgi:hypothetical protein